LTVRRKVAQKMVLETLCRLGFSSEKVSFIDHHLSHAAGAFFLSGFNEALVFTSDGKGDHVSHRTYIMRSNSFEKLYESRAFDSVGFFYSCITSYLGFKKLRHEGKITGLASYGDFDKVENIPSPIGLANESTIIRNLLISNKEADNIYRVYLKMLKESPRLLFSWISSSSAIMAEYSQYCFEKYFERYFKGIRREHVALFAQRHLENTITELVIKQEKIYKIPYICLSGGTFGNVRLNQKIAEIDGVKSVFIQPAMGDGGLSVGGALWKYWQHKGRWKRDVLENAYLGPDFMHSQIESALKKYNLEYIQVNNIEKYIADALVRNRIVGRFKSRMEWGPRALGNRTILANATDASINITLNKRLKRTEFMPFAPIIMEEYAGKYFKGYDTTHPAPRFMTITYDVFENKKAEIPAVVHVDETARPQVVGKEENPSLYNILLEYYKVTDIPVLINTSFNMHEEPIVCTPEDAARAYQQGAVDLLAIEDFIVQ